MGGQSRKVTGGHWSALGHSRHFDGLPMISGLRLETDIVRAGRHVSKVPRGEVALFALGVPSPLFHHSTMAP
jgi:hypothetical protein